MVEKYFEASQDWELLRRALPTLVKEWTWWHNNRSVLIGSRRHRLNRYHSTEALPRPESFIEDMATAQSVPPADRSKLFTELRSGAESGWDFSSRWMRQQPMLSSVAATDIVPVDLNSILYKSELALERVSRLLKNESLAQFFADQAAERFTAIQAVLWDEKRGLWSDYNLTSQQRSSAFYPSNVFPLWAGAFDSRQFDVSLLLKSLSLPLAFPGGIPASMVNTSQQWDFPTTFSSIVSLTIDSLSATKNEHAERAAEQLALKWIASNYCGWLSNASHPMFEKFDVLYRGVQGSGGEYQPQVGFGWTNGVAIKLLSKFGAIAKAPTSCTVQ